VPEAGGDAAIGAVKCLRAQYGREIMIVGLDAIQVLAYRPDELDALWKLGRIDLLSKSDLNVFLKRLREGGRFTLLPTGEFFPAVVSTLLDLPNVLTNYVAHGTGWEVARDKWQLAQMFPDWVVPTSQEWTVDHKFMKPRHGVGSRGCKYTYSEAEASAPGCADGQMVFTQFLGGNDHVVDVVNGQAWTRQVMHQRAGADVVMHYYDNPTLEERALAIARDLRAPVANVQFRYDADQRPFVIDVGLRFSGALCGTLQLGCNPVAYLLGDAPFTRPTGFVVRRWEEIAWTEII
jgi:hypothetical protein